MSHRFSFVLQATVAAALLALSGHATADEKSPVAKNALAPLERYIGEWVIHGRWASGEELRARAVYEWGVGKRIIVAKTYVMNGDSEYQRYEGILFWHPRKKSLAEHSFAYNGDLSQLIVESVDKDTLKIGWIPYDEAEPSNVRQILKFKDDNAFVWTVTVKTGNEWQQIMEGTWQRKEK